MASVTDSRWTRSPSLASTAWCRPFRPASAGHLATRELVDDDDLAVLDQVVAVAAIERVGAQGLLEVAGQPRVGGVEVLDADQLLDLLDALLGRRDGVLLEVDEVVAALLGALRPLVESGHEPRELVVHVGRLLGLAADDERRARLVDEDVVDLVDDGVRPAPLDPLAELGDHVVAQVVEAELVVGAVGDVGRVGLLARDRAQVLERLVGAPVVGVEEIGDVVLDDADGQADAVEDGAHPLRVALGQVVVDGDHVDAAAAHGVERGGDGTDQRLALAGAHLGDLALVQDHGAQDLDVVRPHLEASAADLANGCEDLRQRVVERLLEAPRVVLASLLGQHATRLALGLELLLGRLGRGGLGAQLLAQRDHALAQLLVGEGLELGLEAIDLVEDGPQASDLALVGVDEARQEVLHGSQKYRPQTAATRADGARAPDRSAADRD